MKRSEDLPAGLRAYTAHETLRDGEKILVRAIRPDDKTRLLEHFHALSPASVHSRFFSMRRNLSDADLVKLTELDFQLQVAVVVTTGEGDGERFIGVGRYIRETDLKRAEVAFAVRDDYQGHGVGTILLEQLAKIARAQGVEMFEADVLAENRQMLGVVEQSGFKAHRKSDSGVVHLIMPIAETKESIAAHADREKPRK